jgi:hypothetical protein
MTDEQPWHSLSEAAHLTRLDREAVRSKARRGQVPSRKNNRGELLVQLPTELLTGTDRQPDHPLTALVTDLSAEIADLRAMLERAKAGRETAEALRVAEREAAETVRDAQVTALRELADRLTAELATARLPWWRRLRT